MKRFALLLPLAWQLLHAQPIRVVNGASFLEDTTFAPGSIISILGPNLADVTAVATDALHLPLLLGSVRVKVAGVSLPLYFVTPTQVNALIDSSVPLGRATLSLGSPTGTFTKDIVLDANAPPAIFSLHGTGTRDGAIQNAVSFWLQPFSVTTAGAPTYLSIYATGLKLSLAPTVTIGGVPAVVSFYGAAPCCAGLQQINAKVDPSLAGAGRVEVAIHAQGATSNIVEAVFLPNAGQGAFPPPDTGLSRNREIAGIAWIPGTTRALVADENDDVIRVIDVKQQKVIRTIALPEGAGPVAIGVDSAGTVAIVAERDRNKAAILDLAKWTIVAEVAVGSGPVSVATFQNLAAVVNQDSDTVSIIDLTSITVTAVMKVGRGPRSIAVDVLGKAYVTNQDSDTLSIINLTTLDAAPQTFTLGTGERPHGVQYVQALGMAVVSEPSAGPTGRVIAANLSTGLLVTADVNADHNGGSSDIAVFGSSVYLTNPSSGTISVSPVSNAGGLVSFSGRAVRMDLGPRSLAVDTLDKLLLVTNQGSGTVVLMDLNSNQVVGRINAVRCECESGDVPADNHSDRDQASNAPAITLLSPASAKAGTTITLAVDGRNLSDAAAVQFFTPAILSAPAGNGPVHGPYYTPGPGITVSNIHVNAAGTQLTATVSIAASVGKGDRLVRVETSNGDSSLVSAANTFQIQ